MLSACPKPRKRATVKRSRDRAEATIKREVRAACVERDGYCRLWARPWRGGFDVEVNTSWCGGDSQWAHMEGFRRFETRGKPPEERHCTHGSLMLCQRHHDAYDGRPTGKTLAITALSDRGADGPLKFERL